MENVIKHTVNGHDITLSPVVADSGNPAIQMDVDFGAGTIGIVASHPSVEERDAKLAEFEGTLTAEQETMLGGLAENLLEEVKKDPLYKIAMESQGEEVESE